MSAPENTPKLETRNSKTHNHNITSHRGEQYDDQPQPQTRESEPQRVRIREDVAKRYPSNIGSRIPLIAKTAVTLKRTSAGSPPSSRVKIRSTYRVMP